MVTRFGDLKSQSAEWYFATMFRGHYTDVSSQHAASGASTHTIARAIPPRPSVAKKANATAKPIVGGEMTLSKKTNTIERAFELACEGECRTLSGLVERLSSEGFNDVQEHFFCHSTRRQLKEALSFLDL
ncbi:hypothetical protein GCM10008023_41090 [Sphingomonas glacialis]|uniref:Uncharacterized protein n=1 Tax=Sphingomonas glacialis TaxID=658225 RepID=A0ABQ3LUW3_9SPHN|nr:hypothetical protein GCM10008023_41090 [Sphingomonas glacialis]